MRQEESITKTTVKFVKGNPSHLVKYLQEANGAYADNNPGDAPHPWGPKRYCLTAAMLKSVMEDEAKGKPHVETLCAESTIKKTIENHDQVAAVVNHPTILTRW